MRKAFAIILLCVVSLYCLSACAAPSLVYPGASMDIPDCNYGSEQQHVSLKADDGTALRGWFFNRGANTPLVVLYTGNAMNVGALNDLAEADATRSYLLMNYRGYGDSEGTPSEELLVKDARRCLSVARKKLGAPSSVTLVGFSLGSGVATQVAAAEKVDSLVLICPFDSITTVACNMVPFIPRLLPLDSWNSAAFAPQITCPVSILRAQHDSIVPPSSTDALLQAFKAVQPKVLSYDCDHNDIFSMEGFTATLRQQFAP